MNDRDENPEGIIDEYWPYDGPHTPESVQSAGIAVDRLLRYIANATGPWNAQNTLPYAASAYPVLGGIRDGVHHLPQILEQLKGFIDTQAQDPSLYDDRRDRPAEETAYELSVELYEARHAAVVLGRRLSSARGIASHLGNKD